MTIDVAQPEHNNIKCYASAFSNIQILLVFLNLRKLILNCSTNLGKKNGNDMTIDVAQPEHNNIECYASVFSNIQMWGQKITFCQKAFPVELK